jgi:hypothetical protein
MSALVRKEIRMVLPAWVAAVLLALSNLLVPGNTSGLREWWYVLPFILCPAVGIFLVLESFGREFSSNTFSNLLAQPVSRERIWRTKTLVTFMALACVLVVWWWAFIIRPLGASPFFTQYRGIMLTAGIFALTIYAGGLWTILLFRQVAVAFWFVLLVPGLLIVALTAVWEVQNKPAGNEIIVGVMVAYAIASFLFARRLFLRAQDVQWTGGVITLPNWVKLPGRTAAGLPLSRRPLMALITKEIHLHQALFVMAGVLALLHLGVVLVRHFAPSLAVHYGFVDLLYKGFWVLWLVMPLLIGCGAVAEERRVGILEAQLCLPTRRRTQFVIKCAVAFGIAILLGAVVPYLFEGHRILPEVRFGSDKQFSEANLARAEQFAASSWVVMWIRFILIVREILPALVLGGISALLVSAAFYASSLARNTLQALAPGVLGFIAAAVLLANAHSPESVLGYAPWRGPLIYLIGLPVLGVTLVWLTFWNFKRVITGWPVWRRNLLFLFSSLAAVAIVTPAIYHRAWEYLEAQPAHAPSRLPQSQVVSMQSNGRDVTIQFRGGRVWSTELARSYSGWLASLLGSWQVTEMFGEGHFMEGTNWMALSHCLRDVIGLKKDGTLWVSEHPETWKVWRRGQPPKPDVVKLVKFGNDTDWKSLVARWTEAFLLKNDGTLWYVGTNHFDWKKKWPGLRAFPPRRFGTYSDWSNIESFNQELILRKRDGRVYVYRPDVPIAAGRPPAELSRWDDDRLLSPAPDLDQHRWRSLKASVFRRYPGVKVGVGEDGRLYLIRGFPLLAPGLLKEEHSKLQITKAEIFMQNIELGHETNWLAVAGNGYSLVTLKADGSLWEWTFPHNKISNLKALSPKRLGTHSDWIGVVDAAGGVVSLAADGSIWFWHLEPRNYNDEFLPLLAPTGRPQRITSILAKED